MDIKYALLASIFIASYSSFLTAQITCANSSKRCDKKEKFCDRAFGRVPNCDEINCRSIENKKVLIIGGSKGIGKAAAEQFALCGAIVVATSRHPQDYPAPVGYTLAPVCLDIADQASVNNFFFNYIPTSPLAGQIDILVNSAALPFFGSLTTTTGDDMKRSFNINLFGYQRTTTAALAFMLPFQDTRVISLGDIKADVPLSGVYGMGKRALQAWTERWNVERILSERIGTPLNLPLFTLLEPTSVQTSFGVDEWLFPTGPGSQGACDPTVQIERAANIQAQNAGIPVSEVAKAIVRIASLKEPKTIYFIDKCKEKLLGKTIPQVLQLAHCCPVDKLIKFAANLSRALAPQPPLPPCQEIPSPQCVGSKNNNNK